MAGDWRTQTFAELVGGPENIVGGPFGSNLTQADYTSDGVPVIRGSNMQKAGRFIAGEFVCVSTEKAAKLSSNQIGPGDIVVTQRGTMGQVSIVPSIPATRYVVSQSQMGIQVRNADPMFIYYLLRSPAFLNFLEGATIQTGVPHINMGLLRTWEVAAPDACEQARISQVLATLDDKIETNRRTAETLEAMARTLFKSWFVDFDPVYAKAEGRLTGLSQDLTSLFPDSFDDEGLPAGWRVEPVSSLFEISGGNTPRTENLEFWGGPHQWATPKDLSGLASPVLLQTERQLTDAGLQQTSSGLLPSGSLLLSTRAPIGYLAFITSPTAINQGFAGFKRKETSTSYAWAWCQFNVDLITGNASGSTFPEISKAVLRQLPMLAPSRPVLDAFGRTADALIARIVSTVSETQTLSALRDALLPKLISGELRIADARKRIVAA